MNVKYLLTVLLAFVITFNFAISEEATQEKSDSSSLSVSLAQDPSFGFYPSVNGSIPIGGTTSLTFYGIFWTQDALAGNLGGIGLLTEFGVGLNFSMLDGKLNINPSLGLGNGKFQSGGGRHIIGDDIVPSVYVTYSTDALETTIGGIYWKGLRREEMVTPYLDQIEYFLQSWYKASNHISVGLYVDHFLITEDNKIETKTNTSYFWFGPAIKFTVSSGASFWFTVGPDFVDYLNNADNKAIKDYYKMVVTFNF